MSIFVVIITFNIMTLFDIQTSREQMRFLPLVESDYPSVCGNFVFMKTKICSLCKESKPISDFSKGNDTKDGVKSRCKTCSAYTYYIKSKKDISIPSLDGEMWLPIKGYEELYEISSFGRVKSLRHIDMNGHLRREYIFNKKDSYSRYHNVILCKGKDREHFGVHRLVANAFIENPENKPEPNHKNCIKYDNRVDNLEWATESENGIHAYENGRITRKGESNSMVKLSEKEVLYIYGSSLKRTELAKRFNVTYSAIESIKAGRTWNHVTNHKNNRKDVRKVY